MANRFSRGHIYQTPLQWYMPERAVPNFEAMATTITNTQNNYDTTNSAIEALRPDALQKHQEQANQYYNKWQEEIPKLADIYQNRGVTEGNRYMKRLKQKVKKEVLDPNSEYNHFGNVKKAYNTQLEEIEKFHEKDPIKANRDYSMHALNAQLGEWDTFYGDGKAKKNITGVSKVAYQDIQKDLIDLAGNIDPDGRKISKSNGRYIYTESGEEVPKERIDQAFNSLMNSPKYKDQQRVEVWDRLQNTDPASYISRNNTFIKGRIKQQNNKLKELKKLASSDKVEDIKELQIELQGLGLNTGKVDGLKGKKTEGALQDLEKRLNLSEAKLRKKILSKDADISDNVIDDYRRNYKDIFESTFGSKSGLEMKADPYGLAKYKDNLKKVTNQEAMFQLGQMMAPKTRAGIVTPERPRKIVEKTGQMYKEAKNNIKQTTNKLNDYTKGFNQTYSTHIDSEQLRKISDIYSTSSRDVNGQVSFDVFKQKLLSYMSDKDESFNAMTDDEIQAIMGEAQATSQEFTDIENSIRANNETIRSIDSYKDGLMTELKTKHKDKFQAIKNKYGMGDITDEAFMEAAITEQVQSSIPSHRGNTFSTTKAKTKTIMNDIEDSLDPSILAKHAQVFTGHVYTPNQDSKIESPIRNLENDVLEAFNAGQGKGFNNEDLMGITWIDDKENEVTMPEGFKANSVHPVTHAGKAQYRFTAKTSDGVFTTYTDIPPTHYETVKANAKAEYAIASGSNQTGVMEKMANLYTALDGDRMSSHKYNEEFNSGNTVSTPIVLPAISKNGLPMTENYNISREPLKTVRIGQPGNEREFFIYGVDGGKGEDNAIITHLNNNKQLQAVTFKHERQGSNTLLVVDKKASTPLYKHQADAEVKLKEFQLANSGFERPINKLSKNDAAIQIYKEQILNNNE